MHLTESCDPQSPHLILHVETTPAPLADGDATPEIHHALKEKELLPAKHLVDTAYLDAQLLAQSQQDYDVDLVGPTRPDYHWQARANEGFAARDFQLDWDAQQARCPLGRSRQSWLPGVDGRGQDVIRITFAAQDCQACPSRSPCTKTKRRVLTIRPRAASDALNAARVREGPEEFQKDSAQRAGIEGTISQGVRACGLRRSRYVGETKTHLPHIATATAMNLVRISNWLIDKPQEQTRTAAFVKAMNLSMAS